MTSPCDLTRGRAAGAMGGTPVSDVPGPWRSLDDGRAPGAPPPRTVGAMSRARQRLGRTAEALVADALERRGMRILARNERTSSVRGEIDLVALDGPALVFVEVKARRVGASTGPERPVMA